MHVRRNILFLIFSGILFWNACQQNHTPIDRFDRDFFALDTSNIPAGLQALQQKYALFLPLFTGEIIRSQTNPKETEIEAVKNFLTAPGIRALYDSVQIAFPSLHKQEKKVADILENYHRLFPDKPVPRVIAIVSEYATDAFTYGDSLCGIGLDMFLGPYHPGYDPQIFPDYLRRQFTPEYIPVRLAKAMAQNRAGEPGGERLIDLMLFNGKILYITHQLTPDADDYQIMGYTEEQMDGSKANESQVWARILTQNLLYSEDFAKFRKLVTPSPNAPVVFQEAPGEIGNWIGWQIIEAYMRRNPNTSMQELLNQKDAQLILEASRYKPRR